MGWELHRRLTYIENNWPYFLGFGLPLTVLTNMTDSIIVSSCIFSIFFPLFLLSSNEAIPIVDTTNFPMRLFTPVIFFQFIIYTRPSTEIDCCQISATKTAIAFATEGPLQKHNMLIQQRIEDEYLGRSHSRQSERERESAERSSIYQTHRPQSSASSSRFSHSPSPNAGPFRYQQPPTQSKKKLECGKGGQ